MFKILTGVIYDGGNPGEAFGGGIYNMSCTLGTSGEPTKVTLNVVSENGTYNPPSLNVTTGGAKTITVGDSTSTFANSLNFYRLYCYKYNINETAGQRTLTAHFVDQGAALDKIFIGLTARHAPVSSAWTLAKKETFEFTVRCLECNTLWPTFKNATGNTTKTLLSTPPGALGSVGAGPATIDGGFAIIGEEQWTDGNCEIPKVEYTFGELCSTIAAMGIGHNLNNFNRSSFYTAAYSGTLKEVLNSWGADFSFSFMIDPTNASVNIVGTDLTNPVGLTLVKGAIASGFNKGGTSLIKSTSETYSLEGTYRQEPIVKSIKPARGFTRQQTSYVAVAGKPITVQDAVGSSAHYGRTDEQLDISMALAKYQPQARLIWLSDQAAQATISGSAKNPFPCLGFIPANGGHITDVEQKMHLTEMFAQSSTGGSIFQHPTWSDTDNYDVFVGVWNPEDQAHGETYDKELADFLGKYGYWHGQKWGGWPSGGFSGDNQLVNPPPSSRDCPLTGWPGSGDTHRYYDLSSKISTLPDSKPYKGNSYPFQNILRSNDGVFAALGMTAGNPPVPIGADPDGDYVFSIEDNAWGTNQGHVDNALYNQWVYTETNALQWEGSGNRSVTDLSHFLPIYARFNSDRLLNDHLRQILPNFDLDFISADNRTKGYFPGIALIPKISKMESADAITGAKKKILEISMGSGTYPNAKVYDSVRRRALEMVGSSAKECTIYCEEDIVSDICECPDIPDPLHKFSSFNAKYVDLKHVGNEVKLIFPVLADYQGYWKAEQSFRGTYPKQLDIMGSPPQAPIGNVMETRILDFDADAGMDPTPTSSGFVQKFIVRGSLHQNGAITLGDYYAELSNLNQNFGGFPSETVNVKIDGIDYGNLAPYLNPQNGLTSVNVSVSGDGLSTDLTFSNRPPKLPKKDVFMQKLNAVSAGQRSRPAATNTSHGGVGLPFNP